MCNGESGSGIVWPSHYPKAKPNIAHWRKYDKYKAFKFWTQPPVKPQCIDLLKNKFLQYGYNSTFHRGENLILLLLTYLILSRLQDEDKREMHIHHHKGWLVELVSWLKKNIFYKGKNQNGETSYWSTVFTDLDQVH